MQVPKFFRRSLYILGGMIAVVILVLAVLAFVQIPLDLTKHKGLLESAATLAIGRTVTVDEKIGVTTSLRPVFTLEGLRIGNPKNFQTGDFAQMKRVELQVRVLPLLAGKLHIGMFSVKGVSVVLLENEEGVVNWSSRTPEKSSSDETPPRPKQEPEKGQRELASDSLVLEELTLEDISVSYRNFSMEEPLDFHIEECTGAALAGKPFTLSIKGTLFQHPFTTAVKAGSLEELLEESRSWMEIRMDIAETRFDLTGDINISEANTKLQMKASVKGDRLDSLDGLLKLDLPSLESYGASALFTMRKKHYELSDLEVYVRESKLTGRMVLDSSGTRPLATIELIAPAIQLDDFDLGDWSPEEGDSEAPIRAEAKSKEIADGATNRAKETPVMSTGGEGSREELFSPKVLGSLGAQLNVTVEKVLSGNDELGSGRLAATVKEGRLSIDPVELNIPGGSFYFATSIKPGREASDASVRAVLENFDAGVLARRANPQTNMGGILNLNMELKSSARRFDELLGNGNGFVGFSGRPENLKAGVVDLWAVNLIAAIVSRGEEDGSKINCVIGRWNMEDGLLKPEVFVIDTSKIRICGEGQVNFKDKHIDMKVAPTPKKPEFFSLATPLEVTGEFSDFGVGVQTGGIVGTAVRFLTSPIHVPLRRLVGKGLPADGEDVCSMDIGPESRPAKPPAGCK
jgi:uncharacterized protein involved in outer membrane biogenesis